MDPGSHGNVLALTLTREHAAAVYSKALEFSPADVSLVRQRARATEYNLEDFFWNQRTFVAGLTVGLTLAAALLGLSRYLRRRRSAS